jgi:hypothetical protein
MKTLRASLLLSAALLLGIAGFSTTAYSAQNMVPNDLSFWDNSANWTSDYGPAYRDTAEKINGNLNFVPCTGEFALCFTSGAEPLPCEPTKDGRFANCTCTVRTGTNFVLISGILNYQVWLDTVSQCNADGSLCKTADSAPVCAAIASGKFIKGADLISTFDTQAQANIDQAIDPPPGAEPPLVCPSGPYAGCMTAPCKQKKGETIEGQPTAVCSCPVFNGVFQLPTPGASCDVGEGLIPSASFNPKNLNQQQ